MTFLNSFESKRAGVNDTVEFVIRVAIVTLSAVILVVVVALAAGLFVPDSLIDSRAVLDTVNPAFQTIIGAFVGLLGGLSLNANARDPKPEEPPGLDAPTLESGGLPPIRYNDPNHPVYAPEGDDDEDDMAPWEKYRNDLRYDADGDGVVDRNDFPDWRSAER